MKIVFEEIKESRGWIYSQGKISLFQNLQEENKTLDIRFKEEENGQLKLNLGGTNGNR